MSFTLTVAIDPASEQKLKNGGYKLCLAKRVGDPAEVKDRYNVVWSGANFLSRNTFRWEEKYAVFGGSEFADGALAEAATTVQAIGFDQTCELTTDCIMKPAVGAVHPTGEFFVNNNCKADMHIGVEQALNGGAMSPIFVTKVVVTGRTTLSPRIQVLVFFDQNLQSKMMFSRSVSRTVEIEYTAGQTSHSAFYNGNEEWEINGLHRPRLAYHPDKGFIQDDAEPL